MNDLFAKLQHSREARDLAELEKYGEQVLFPRFSPATSLPPAEVFLGKRRIVNFGSNDYLGLTREPSVIEAAVQATRRFGTGCSGSRLLNGTIELHLTLENELARFLNKPAALLLTTGYQSNLAAVSALARSRDAIIADEYCHASIVDGMRLSYARRLRFRHNSAQSLGETLENIKSNEAALIILEGVYSTGGDLGDLPGLLPVCQTHRVLLDDAHGIGVLGKHGRGTAEHYDVESEIDIVSGTFSKSLASSGGFIASSQEVVEFVRHYSSAFVFSASMSPAALGAAREALRIVQVEPQRRTELLKLAGFCRACLAQSGFSVPQGITPVIAVKLGDGDIRTETIHILKFSQRLLDAGFYVNPIFGNASATPLIRVNVSALHTQGQIVALTEAMLKIRQEP